MVVDWDILNIPFLYAEWLHLLYQSINGTNYTHPDENSKSKCRAGLGQTNSKSRPNTNGKGLIKRTQILCDCEKLR